MDPRGLTLTRAIRRHKRPKMMQKQPILMIFCGIIPD